MINEKNRNQMFLLTPIISGSLTLTPDLEEKIEKSRKEIAQGKWLRSDSKEQMNDWLDSI